VTTPIRVLLVDDHPVVRDGLRGMLESEHDIEVVGEAASGPEAVASVTQSADAGPDLVLMDLRMPGGDGVPAIRALRRRGVRPRILVLTAYDTDRDVVAALDAGADGFLLKDTPRAELVRAIRDVAGGRPALTSQALEALTRRVTHPELTVREVEVLRVIAGGGTNKTAAGQLFVSEATVKTHLLHAYDKLGVSDRAAAVRIAFERGLL